MTPPAGPASVCYLDGEYLLLAHARVSPLDRAFLFGDAVYEVVPVYARRPFRLKQHLERLERSLHAIRMPPVMSQSAWAEICGQLLSRNAADTDSHLYLQVSRGMEFGRNHAWSEGIAPTVFAYCTYLDPIPASMLQNGVAAITAPDIRWARRDIKSTALLGNVLLKKLAADAGAYETIMLEDGWLTEGSSTTVHVVNDGLITVPPNGHHILPGTTRDVVSELALRTGLRTASGAISEQQLRSADEIWLGFATRGVVPVTTLDAKPVGTGRPGPWFVQIRAAFDAHIRELAGTAAL